MLVRITVARAAFWSLVAALVLAAGAAQADTAAAGGALAKADVEAALKAAHAKYRDLKEGKNADYIPALAKVPSDLFGIALVTVDGQVFTIGDAETPFSIQSISKVFTMAEVMAQSGAATIENGVGVDATGDVFNSIVAIEKDKGHEMNALVNPGAIATTSLVKGADEKEIWSTILATYGAFAGRELALNQEVYESEAATNQRNQAIAALMSAYGLIKSDPARATDIYTRQCSVNVNAKDLATMAATLANGGVNPLTKKQVMPAQHVPELLAVMATAGFYDESGDWMYSAGLPAKTGVGGGIMGVVPGVMGVAAFAPPLDDAGNSVKAQAALSDIVGRLNLNIFHPRKSILAEQA